MARVALVKVFVFAILSRYLMNWRHFSLNHAMAVMGYSSACSLIVIACSLLGPSPRIPRGVIVMDFCITAILGAIVAMWPVLWAEASLLSSPRKGGSGKRRGVVFGCSDAAELLIKETIYGPQSDIVIEAIFDDDPDKRLAEVHGVRVLGGIGGLRAYLKTHAVDVVVMAVPSPTRDQMKMFNQALDESKASVKVLRPLLEIIDKSPAVDRLEETGVFDLMAVEEVEAGRLHAEATGPSFIPVASPTLPEIEDLFKTVKGSYESGQVTGGGIVKLFEEEVHRFTRVEHVVAVSSCTSGLMLVFSAMGFPEGSEVIVPSFTFAATVQALSWNRLKPVFVDCLPHTMTMDPDEVVKAIGPGTVAIYPVTIFGLPPDLGPLEDISHKYGLPMISDSAQGLGSTYKGRPAGGFGLCEAFSLSPSKVITAMEGGLITTNDRDLAQKLRSMRDYGKGPDGQEMLFQGLSSRMVEFDAAVGVLNLRRADRLVSARLRLMENYRTRLAALRGWRPQEMPPDRTSSGNLFAFLVGDDAPVDRDALFENLKAQNIQTKKYFYPPVHAQSICRDMAVRVVGDLPNTWSCSRRCLTLPLYSHMTEQDQERVCSALERAFQG